MIFERKEYIILYRNIEKRDLYHDFCDSLDALCININDFVTNAL